MAGSKNMEDDLLGQTDTHLTISTEYYNILMMACSKEISMRSLFSLGIHYIFKIAMHVYRCRKSKEICSIINNFWEVSVIVTNHVAVQEVLSVDLFGQLFMVARDP
jgi:hypothetical protein